MNQPQNHPDRRVLRNNTTGQFFTATGLWTDNPAEAHNFPSYLSVLEACSRHRLADAEVLFRRDQMEFVLPLPHLDE